MNIGVLAANIADEGVAARDQVHIRCEEKPWNILKGN
jgi:hypothetical protein